MSSIIGIEPECRKCGKGRLTSVIRFPSQNAPEKEDLSGCRQRRKKS